MLSVMYCIFFQDAPVRPNAGRILGLDIIAVCQAILLLLSCLDVSQQHAVFSQKLYNLLVSGVSLLQMFGVILPLLGGTVQGLSICLAGHSRYCLFLTETSSVIGVLKHFVFQIKNM